MIENEVQKNNYFEYRNIDPSIYDNNLVPAWIKHEIDSKELNILDYGCGFGQNLKALSKEGFENIYGIDIEENAIIHCRESGLTVKKIDLYDLKNPFEFRFDIIILTHIIEHIPKQEIINTLISIKKDFLAEHGKLLIAVPNAQSKTGTYWRYEDWTHTTLFTSGSIYYVLKASGFLNVEFLDVDCTMGGRTLKVFARKILLKLYIANNNFWNKVICTSYHKPSPQIFSFEIKCKAF